MGASDAVSILRLHSMRRAEVKSERAAPSDLRPSSIRTWDVPSKPPGMWCGHDYHGLRLRHAVPAMVAPSLCGEAPT